MNTLNGWYNNLLAKYEEMSMEMQGFVMIELYGEIIQIYLL